jgi:hypothetical protein
MKYTKYPRPDGNEFHVLLGIKTRLLGSLDVPSNAELKQLKMDVLDRWLGAYQIGFLLFKLGTSFMIFCL